MPSRRYWQGAAPAPQGPLALVPQYHFRHHGYTYAMLYHGNYGVVVHGGEYDVGLYAAPLKSLSISVSKPGAGIMKGSLASIQNCASGAKRCPLCITAISLSLARGIQSSRPWAVRFRV